MAAGSKRERGVVLLFGHLKSHRCEMVIEAASPLDFSYQLMMQNCVLWCSLINLRVTLLSKLMLMI